MVQNHPLVHHGVKGMHWGVRNDRAASNQNTADRSRRVATGTASKQDRKDQFLGKGFGGKGGLVVLHPAVAAKLAARYDKKATKAQEKQRKAEAIQAHEKWKKEAGGTEMANKVFQKAAKDFEPTAKIVNEDPNYKGKDLSANKSLARDYDRTMSTLFNEHLAQASVDLTLNNQGHAYIYQLDRSTGYMRGVEHHIVGHADISMPDYKVEFDSLGHVVKCDVVTEIKHYGVKGMKWGVRRDRTGSSGPTAVSVIAPTGKRIRTTGGTGHPASEDALRVATTRQVGRASGVHSLSNKEMQDVVKRMNLERQYRDLTANPGLLGKGQQFVKSFLGMGNTANQALAFANSPAGKQMKEALKNK